MYKEEDLTWSSVEKDVSYEKVVWHLRDNEIPKYTFLDKDGKKLRL